MQWTKPDFEEITLGLEVTAYVNTDRRTADKRPARTEAVSSSSDVSRETST